MMMMIGRGLCIAEHTPVPGGQSCSSSDKWSKDAPGGHTAAVGMR